MAITSIVTRQIRNAAVTLAKLGIFTTKGDLLTRDSTNHVRLGVGSNGHVLTANSAATNGIEWAAPTGTISTANFVYNETPAGTVNGSNAAFTLANTPTTGTVRVYVNGIRQSVGAGNDYTIATTTITFEAGSVPETGDAIICDYMK